MFQLIVKTRSDNQLNLNHSCMQWSIPKWTLQKRTTLYNGQTLWNGMNLPYTYVIVKHSPRSEHLSITDKILLLSTIRS